MALLIQCGQPVIARDNSAYGDSYWSGVAFIGKRLSELGIHPYQLAGPRPAGRLPAPGPQKRSSSTAWPCPSACPTPARPCGPPATSAGSGLDAPGSGRTCPPCVRAAGRNCSAGCSPANEGRTGFRPGLARYPAGDGRRPPGPSRLVAVHPAETLAGR